ncbi:hypothetical protein KOW79_001491 [Hemibagrus wyckioides]|uniref:Dynein light chain n=1 Tax=Hemibagrus wyckioides TaxID=337641 RepID=A0A9D3STZ4_9TELE|nr:hypothetical protein KOW79_001491 [Hemibagrus wyckioides]
MAETGESKKEEADYKRLHSFPLIRHTDMPEEMRVETMELCVTACEKFATNNESAAKMIKESMDKKFGSSWHVVIGEGFGFEIGSHQENWRFCPSHCFSEHRDQRKEGRVGDKTGSAIKELGKRAFFRDLSSVHADFNFPAKLSESIR